ncbi:hypothetical protein AB0H57_10065 [Micromonospora sp. NPDC050686]|uniref:hypothetical protein n=1 Tax=Micromonospora sp. NPDC050686 TaxID=3154631 RepID=UPI0034061C56
MLAVTRHLEGSFPAVSYFEHDVDLPFVVCVNLFDGVLTHPLEDVRAALALSADVPVTACDARDPASVTRTLLVAVEHTMARTGGPAPLAPDPRQSNQWRHHA